MSYRIEGKDIVISGFEKGIANSPYEGIADMRNIELLSVPGEASVQYANVTATLPPVVSGRSVTFVGATDVITYSGAAINLYEGCAIYFPTSSGGGISTNTPYYVTQISGQTFKIKVAPGVTSHVDISADGTGTFTTYQYGNQRGVSSSQQVPVSYYVDRNGSFSGGNAVLLVDASNYVWIMLSADDASGVPAGALVFAGNIGGIGASLTARSGIALWNGYILLFGVTKIDYVLASAFWAGTGPTPNWFYSWETITSNATRGRIGVLISQEDGNVYWTSTDGLGSIIEQPGATFNPASSTTYTINSASLQVPATDESTCLAELGSNLIIGGQRSFIYVWDKISLGFTGLLNIPDTYTVAIVAASQNAYVFAGNRGRIYITNGSGIDLYKKLSDYISGLSSVSPFIQWGDANFSRNQLIFGFSTLTAGASRQNTTAGAWAIDLDSDALRELNLTTYTGVDVNGYTGITAAVIERPPSNSSNPSTMPGTELVVGWCDTSNSAYGVDIGSAIPYSNWETYIDTDMIPVGTFLSPLTPAQLEWKTSAPLLSSEGVRIYYRTKFNESFSLVGSTTNKAGAISDIFKANFQKVQWAQFRIELKAAASSSSSFVRLTEMRLRNVPSQ